MLSHWQAQTSLVTLTRLAGAPAPPTPPPSGSAFWQLVKQWELAALEPGSSAAIC